MLDLVSVIHDFLVLQKRLVATLRLKYPNASDFRFLLDFPKSGELNCEHTTWTFARHGAGIAFTSPTGVVVDVHRNLERPEIIDAWRLVRYLESAGAEIGENLSEARIDAQLRKLLQSGELMRTDSPNSYKLL